MRNRSLFFLACLCLLLLSCGQETTTTELTTASETSGEQAKALFEKANDLQRANEFEKAIALYEQLIALSPTTGDTEEAAYFMCEGLLQSLYCYIFSARREDGAAYLGRIHHENKLWIAQNCPRDVEVTLAYALYENARLPEAVEMIGHALSLPEEGRNEELLYADYGIAGAIYNHAGQVRKAVACSEKCVEILRSLSARGALANALSNLIYQYQQVGEFEKAFSIYEELMESEGIQEYPYHRCAAEVNLIQLFHEWGLEEEIEQHLLLAAEAARESREPEALLRVINLQTSLLLEKGLTDDASLLLDSIAPLLPPRDQPSFYHRFYDQHCLLRDLQGAPAKAPNALTNARKLLAQLQAEPLDHLTSLTCYSLANSFAGRKEPDLAEEAYLHTLRYAEEKQILNLRRKAAYALAEICRQTHRPVEANRYFQLYDEADRLFTERRNAGILLQLRVKYETREKEQLNQQLLTEIELKKRTMEYYIATGAALALLAFTLGCWLAWRNRHLRLRHEAALKQQEIERLQHREAGQRLQQQEQQLRQIMKDRLELNRMNEELRAEIEQSGAQSQLQELMSRLSPRLLTSEEEQEFRRQFGSIYPLFLPNLRELHPTLTPAEEILSMLIRLHLNNQEIALALGNNLSSVHTSRSRLRKKLNIEKEDSLEEFIYKI